MIRFLCLVPLLLPPTLRAQAPEVLATGLKNPESVAVGGDRRIYVTTIGERGKDGDGAVFVIDKGKTIPFATELDDPKGIAPFQNFLFVADKNRVWRFDLKGTKQEFAPAKAFPSEPINLNDVVVDPESGIVYVSDSGDKENKGGAIYRIRMGVKKGASVTVVADQKTWPELSRPNGLAMDGASHLLVADSGAGKLYRIGITSGKRVEVAKDLGHVDGLAWDYFGRLYISDIKGGRVFAMARPDEKPVVILKTETPADLCTDSRGRILVPLMKDGMVVSLKPTIPGAEVDESPLPLKAQVAFPDLKWTGWSPETDAGTPNPLRLICLTHAGDGSNRVFVATQHGVIHVFPNDQMARETKVFLDITSKVNYIDKENEEGFLGLAFHPKFKDNGEFFVFYTLKRSKAKLTNVVCRYRVSKEDPDKADPNSEEEILRVERPFWNHDGGTVVFGPDGYLYIALGDGGAANDPFNNAQNLKTLLGSILRIDIDRKEDGKAYAIPKDNPFVGKAPARPEIYAYGLRNVWRMAFDRQTGKLWAGDVGQNLYEEINIIEKGGNYGWKIRESMHPFTAEGISPRKDLIEPIWEYHHDLGKSITGGNVYRGKRLPMLDGAYLYGDYLTNKLWALRYDEKKGRVTANQPIADPGIPMLSFGEDQDGDVYFLVVSLTGNGIYRFVEK